MGAVRVARLAWGCGLGAVLLAGCAAPATVARPARRPAPEAPPRPPLLGLEQRGQASWYGRPHHGRQTANGEVYDMNALTAAHRTLPFGTRVLVTHAGTGRSVEVRINDRGPFVDGRIIDLSYAAARRLGVTGAGIFAVTLRVVALPDGTREADAAPSSTPTSPPAPTSPPVAAPAPAAAR